MTAESKDQDIHLHRRERRPIPPFGDGSNPGQVSQAIGSALDSCRFAPFPDKPMAGDRTYILESYEYDKELEPRFELKLDSAENLALSVGATSADLCLSVSARTRHIKRYWALDEWELNAVPENWRPKQQLLRNLPIHSDISFIVAIRVVSDKPGLRKNGLDPGKVISRREFAIRKPTDPSFPFQWVDFEETDYPNEMLWVIKWKELDDQSYDLPVEDVLTVWMNKKAEEPLMKIAEISQGRNIGWKMLAAEITTEIWHEVLTKIEDVPNEDEYDSLAGQIFTKLARESGKSYAEILDIAKGDEDARTELRSFVSQIVKVVT